MLDEIKFYTEDELHEVVYAFRVKYFNQLQVQYEDATMPFTELYNKTIAYAVDMFPEMSEAQLNQVLGELFSIGEQFATDSCQRCGDPRTFGYIRTNGYAPYGLPVCEDCYDRDNTERQSKRAVSNYTASLCAGMNPATGCYASEE